MSKIDGEMRREIVELIDERVRAAYVTREDFSELKAVVADLAAAQKRTEQRLDELSVTVRDLSVTVRDLSVAVRDLAAAQKRTEEELHALVGTVRDLHVQVGGLSHTVGFTLDDRAIKSLPALLARDHGIEVEGELTRRFVDCGGGRHVEVNVLGRGRRQGRSILILGESKSQPSVADVNRFARTVGELHPVLGGDEVFPVLIVYSIHPVVQEEAESKGMRIYVSYQLA